MVYNNVYREHERCDFHKVYDPTVELIIMTYNVVELTGIFLEHLNRVMRNYTFAPHFLC